jgi:hypothetical protein
MYPRPQLPGVSARGRDSLHSFRVFSLARVSTTGNATPAAWRRGGGSRTARARRCRVRGRKVRPARKVRFRSAAERSRSLRSRQSAAAGGTRPRRPAASSGTQCQCRHDTMAGRVWAVISTRSASTNTTRKIGWPI